MRIALVAPDCNRKDGQARYVAELGEGLGRLGHEVQVFSVGFADTDPALVRHRKVASPARAARLRFFTFLAAASLALHRERFDLVHGLGASCWPMDVLTAQFCQAAWDEVLRREAPAGLAGSALDGFLRRAIAAVERRVFASPRVRRLVVVAKRVQADVARHYGREGGVVVLPQGVDLRRFHPSLRAEAAEVRARYQVADGAFLVAFLGEFERKNLGTVIDALALSRDQRIVLVAAGGSDPAPYRERARARGIEARVRLVPRTAEPERLMAAADAFAFPTLYDPFGTVTLEAAACGTAVLTSTRPGFAEWIEHGRSGFTFDDPFDAAAMAACLDDLSRAPERAVAVGRAGRALAEGFSWSSVVARTEALYRDLAAPGRDRFRD
jgi:UDP-glucose:(heptosyl)LPS alpha-1,3-glucosyltransferase